MHHFNWFLVDVLIGYMYKLHFTEKKFHPKFFKLYWSSFHLSLPTKICKCFIGAPYFNHIYYAFALDNNFCFFQHANELIYVQIHLTSSTEFRMILNQALKQPFGPELIYIKNICILKFLVKDLQKKLMKESYF